jgi:hypothetical protein
MGMLEEQEKERSPAAHLETVVRQEAWRFLAG